MFDTMKTSATKPPGYDAKPGFYFEQARPEMLEFVPANCKRILDVGCSQGNFGKTLKQSRTVEIWGVEPVASAAATAATKLDRVIEGVFDADTELPPAHFDAVIFNDVLEHLMDPHAALRVARKLLTKNGVIVASIPNIRHFPAQWDIVVRGEWDYGDSGILDRTHLRFFTRKSIIAMFGECGFTIEKIQGINPLIGGTTRKWLVHKMVNALTLNAVEDMKYLQFAVVAKPAV
jgi:2-polyprenyl-3-methyl-5-hydroxy-6-metoxy-1,4-benzoquinol methylase